MGTLDNEFSVGTGFRKARRGSVLAHEIGCAPLKPLIRRPGASGGILGSGRPANPVVAPPKGRYDLLGATIGTRAQPRLAATSR
jgi:hypothetical protein